MRTRPLVFVVLVGALVVSAGYAHAQFGRGRGFGGEFFGEAVRFAPVQIPDRHFTICRIMYTSVRREANGGGWRTDYPFGEVNLLTRLSELTKTPVSFNGARQRPNQWVVGPT